MNSTRRRFMQWSALAFAGLAWRPYPALADTAAAKTVALRAGRQVSALGMGSWRLGQGRHPDAQEIEALRTGIHEHMTVIDTAEMYGGGAAERLIGRAIQGRRDDVFLVSKVLPSNATAEGIPRACRASLDRLGVERLDLYLLHWRGGSDLNEVVPAFEQLKRDGLIRDWGVSNFGIDDMQQLWQVPDGERCVANQVLYNLDERGIEYDLLPWCREHGVAVMAYSPLGSGELIDDPTLMEIGQRHGVTGPAVALAWAIRSGQVIAIPESGTPAHIREDAKALSLSLSEADMRKLDHVFPPPSQHEPLSFR